MKSKAERIVESIVRKHVSKKKHIILEKEDYRDVDEDRIKRLTKVVIELDHIMDEVKIGPPYSINSEISNAIKLIERAIDKIKR